MIREDLFKEYPDNHGYSSTVLNVDIEISDYEPRFANVDGTVDLVMGIVEGNACVIGFANPDLWAHDQDGGELGEYTDYDNVFTIYKNEVIQIEADTHASDLRG